MSPPIANRGGESATDDQGGLFGGLVCRCHWLSGSFPAEHTDQVREKVTQFLANQAEDRLRGLYSYEKGCQWDEKAILCWSEGRGEAFLELNGSTLDTLDAGKTLELMRWLSSLEFNCTRFDAAVDDHHRIASMDDVHAAADAGNYAFFKKSLALREKERDGKVVTDTHYFGTRGKDGGLAYLRVYDKNLESGGLIDCIRWECEFRKEKAEVAFAHAVAGDSTESFLRTLGGLVAGCVDFLDRSSGATNLDRLPRLEWWERLTALLAFKVRESVGRIVPPLFRTIDTCKRIYGPSLALLRTILNGKGINVGAVVENWCDWFEGKINWHKQKGRDLGVTLSVLLEGPNRAALAALER